MRLVLNEKLQYEDVNDKLKDALDLYVEALDPENEEDPSMLEPDREPRRLKSQSVTLQTFTTTLAWASTLINWVRCACRCSTRRNVSKFE